MAQLSLSALLISAATTAALDDNRSPLLQEETRSELVKLVAVRAESVDSIDNGMHQNKNLRLQANITNTLQIPNQSILWTISQHDKVVTRLRGNSQGVDLPAVEYTVKLSVGKYSRVRQVSIQHDQQIQPYFSPELARLQLRSNQNVDWLITSSDSRSYRINGKSRLNELLPAGNYTVHALFRDLTLNKNILIKTGQQLKAVLNIPVGKVRLMATKESQPLFKTVVWDVYRLTKDERKLVGKYRLHNRSISMPPGHYEAVASYRNNSGRRQFRVREDSTNNVVLALD